MGKSGFRVYRSTIIIAIVVEGIGLGLVAAALIEGVSTNPAKYVAPMGAFLIATGGFLMNKVVKALRGFRE